jgi:CRP-like cAMP-binding protein
MLEVRRIPFNAVTFLANEGPGRKIVHFKAKQTFFSQGGSADTVFYLQAGQAKLTVISKRGKEAIVTHLAVGDFAGEESLSAGGAFRTATATAVVACVALRIDRDQMLRVLREEPELSALFLKFMLARGIRTQADLIDQLFNSSERRLARILLLMANFGGSGEPTEIIPKVTQETLAKMIGTTRSRVSFFMNRFKKLGYIEYNGRIHVHTSLLTMVLQDQLPEQNASRPLLLDPPPSAARRVKRAKSA